MSEQPPYPSQPERQEPDPNWPPPAYAAVPTGYGPAPQYYAPRAYIPPGVTLSSWGRRLAAFLLDFIVQTLLSLGISVALGFIVYALASGSDRDSAGWAAGTVAYFVLALAFLVAVRAADDAPPGRAQRPDVGQAMARDPGRP